MEVEQWYAIALGVLLALFSLRRIWLFLDRWIFPRFLSFFLRHIRYRLVLRGREWLPWTWFEAICLLFYLVASIFAEFLFVQTLREMERRAAILVTVSLFPLYVSGKTHLALDWLGMPLPLYVFLQRSMCGIALFYSIIHFVGVLRLRVRAGEIATSGYITAGSLLAIWTLWLVGFLLSLYLRRVVFSSVFQAMHTTLTLAFLAGLFWHVLSLPSPTNTSRGTVLAAAIIWLLSALVRLLRVIYRGRARIQGRRDYKKVVRIHVRFKRRINIAPGSYFYVLFPSLRNIVYSYPFIAIPFDFTSTAPQGIRDFVFILDADKHSRILNRLHEGHSLLLDGPYGSEDGGEPYENLILTARGIGIVGILPTALEIARRKRHITFVKERVQELQKKQSQLLLELQQTSTSDLESLEKELARIGSEEAAIQANPLDRSTTRRVDILWELDDNTQAEWVQSQIKALQDSDPRGTLFVFWCIFPSPEPKNFPPPFKTTDHFLRLYPSVNLPSFKEIFETKLSEALQSPGETLVLTCGESPFRDIVRYGVIDRMASGSVIHFREAEFQPKKSKDLGQPRDLTTIELKSYLSRL